MHVNYHFSPSNCFTLLTVGEDAVTNIPNGTIEEIVEPPLESEKKQGTAKKIMDLLTEIETTNLVEKPVLDNFHPCPVCSGRLLTV